MKSICMLVGLLWGSVVFAQSHAERMSYHLHLLGHDDLAFSDEAWQARENEAFTFGPAWPMNLPKPSLETLQAYSREDVLQYTAEVYGKALDTHAIPLTTPSGQSEIRALLTLISTNGIASVEERARWSATTNALSELLELISQRE